MDASPVIHEAGAPDHAPARPSPLDGPLVSVITIFFNADRFISSAIESVINQTYTNWELILVDDGSTDGSSAIARRYAERRPTISYVQHPGHVNLGTGPSRNLGVSQSIGEYVAFLDADDVWLPRKLEEQVALLEQNPPAVMVYGVSEMWYSWTGRQEDIERDHVLSLGLPSASHLGSADLISRVFLEQRAAVPGICSILVRRDALGDADWFPPGFKGAYEDQALYVQLILAGDVIGFDRCWDRYRQHETSLTATVDRAGQAYQARLTFIRWLGRTLMAHRVRSARLWLRLGVEQVRCYLGLLVSYLRRRPQLP